MKKKFSLGALSGFKELCKSELITIGGSSQCKGAPVVKKHNWVPKDPQPLSPDYSIGITIVPPSKDPLGPSIPAQPRNNFISPSAYTIKMR